MSLTGKMKEIGKEDHFVLKRGASPFLLSAEAVIQAKITPLTQLHTPSGALKNEEANRDPDQYAVLIWIIRLVVFNAPRGVLLCQWRYFCGPYSLLSSLGGINIRQPAV